MKEQDKIKMPRVRLVGNAVMVWGRGPGEETVKWAVTGTEGVLLGADGEDVCVAFDFLAAGDQKAQRDSGVLNTSHD